MNNKYNHPAFTPVSFGSLELPGRIVRSATELFIAHDDGHIGEAEPEVYSELARHPLAMFLTAHTCVSPEGRSGSMNAIWDDDFIADQTVISERAKSGGAKCLLQIGHGGMKAEGNNFGKPVYTPDSMTREQISETVEAFGRAAFRAKQAGFDGVQLHCAHFYLLSEFFYPQLNHRSDIYGGDGRGQIIFECAEAAKKYCGDDFPVLIKINGDNGDDDGDYLNALSVLLGHCEAHGISGAEISGYNANPPGIPNGPYFLERAKTLYNYSSVPLILVGGIRSVADIDAALNAGISAVSACRPFMRHTDFIERIFEGLDSECLGCNRCFRAFEFLNHTRCKQVNK